MLPGKQERMLWSAGKLRLVDRCAEVLRTLLEAQGLECTVSMSRELQETIPEVKISQDWWAHVQR